MVDDTKKVINRKRIFLKAVNSDNMCSSCFFDGDHGRVIAVKSGDGTAGVSLVDFLSQVQRLSVGWNQIFANLISIYETLKPIIPVESLGSKYLI